MTYVNAGQLLIIPAYDMDKASFLSVYQYTTRVELDPISGVGADGLVESGNPRFENANSPYTYLLQPVPNPRNECVSLNLYSSILQDGKLWGWARMSPCEEHIWQKFSMWKEFSASQIQGVCNNIENVKEQH